MATAFPWRLVGGAARPDAITGLTPDMAEGGGGWGKLWTGPLNIAAPLLKGMGAVGDVSPKHYEDLQKLILDSQGRLKTDKVTVDRMRDFLAKTVVQGTEGDRLPQPFGKRVSR